MGRAPLTTQIPSNGYPLSPGAVPKGEVQDILDNIHGRLVDLKSEVQVTISSLGSDATDQALVFVSGSIAPQIQQLTDEINAMLAQLNEADATLTTLLNAGIEASSVTFPEIQDFTARDTLAAIVEILAKIEAETTARTDAFAALKAVQFVDLTADTTLEAGRAYRLRTPGITMTMPPTPADGASISIIDGGVTTRDSVSYLTDGSETLTLDEAGFGILLWWDNANWRVR